MENTTMLAGRSIETLVEKTGSKFLLASLAGKRAREIENYRTEAGLRDPDLVPPLAGEITDKPMSIAMQEIEAGKIIAGEIKKPEPVAETLELDNLPDFVTEDDITSIFGSASKEIKDIFDD